MKPRYRNSPTSRAPFLTRTRLLIFLAAFTFAGLLLGLALFRARQTLAAHYDTLVVNGRIVDGTGAPPRPGTVGIRAGRVVEVEWSSFATADRVIDAEGMVVAPGFIDVHTHIERNVESLAGPLAAENFVAQGFTTLVTGNCGRSAQSLAQFFSRLEAAGMSVNVASLVGHNTVRRQVLGESSRAAGADELARMKTLVARAFDDGALGFSTGLEYEPGMFAPRSEIEALAGVAAERGGLYATHMRDEGNGVADSLREAIEVARRSGAPLEISHLKARGRTNWGNARALVEMVRAARAEGLRVSFDAYPYTASSTTLDLLLPKEAREGDAAALRARLRDRAARERIVEGVIAQMRGEGWQDFSFARVAYFHFDQTLNGLSIPEVAARLGGARLNETPSPSAPVAETSGDPAVVSLADGAEAKPAPAQAPAAKPDATAAQTPDDKNADAPKKNEGDAKGDAGKPAQAGEGEKPAPKKDEKPNTSAPPKSAPPAGEKSAPTQKPAPPASSRPGASLLTNDASSHFRRASLRVEEQGATADVRAQAEAVCWMAAHGGAQMIFENMDGRDVAEILSFPGCMLGSDSGVRTVGEGRPHPRGFGSAPRFLGLFARDEKLFPLEEAVRRMTSLPAETFRIPERGKLLPGFWADVVIFDPARVKDLASYDDPFRPPEGIAYVLVNGEVAYERGQMREQRAGRVVRRAAP